MQLSFGFIEGVEHVSVNFLFPKVKDKVCSMKMLWLEHISIGLFYNYLAHLATWML